MASSWRVVGTGRFRFNIYHHRHDDVIAWKQYRFPTLKEAVGWLCWERRQTVHQVRKGDAYYDIDEDGHSVGGEA